MYCGNSVARFSMEMVKEIIMYAIIGIVIGITLRVIYRKLKMWYIRKYLIYDAENRCWHEEMRGDTDANSN